MRFRFEDEYFIKWLWANESMQQSACWRCFLIEDKVVPLIKKKSARSLTLSILALLLAVCDRPLPECGSTFNSCYCYQPFLPRDAMLKRVMRCPSVCLSVTFVDSVKTNNHRHNFSPSGSHIIVVFPYQTSWQYSDGNLLSALLPPNGGVECRWGRQKSRSGCITCCEPFQRQYS